MNIDIIYALPENPTIIRCHVSAGSSVYEAIVASGILMSYSIDIKACSVGIYGKLVALDHLVQLGDRIEIYRPLLADAKEIRRRRAKEKKEYGKIQ